MSRERTRGSKLAQSRRRNDLEDDDGETGPAIIDDSASEVGSDQDLQLSASENEEEDEDEEGPNQKGDVDRNQIAKASASPPTSDGYDRLEDDTLNGKDFVDLAASTGSVGATRKVTDTEVILNGFKDIPTEEDVTSDHALNFDELDDSISFEPRPSEVAAKTSSPSRGAPLSRLRGAARGRPDRETYWQRRNKEKEEYKKRLEDPTFTPFVGDFFMHDSRKNRQFESLNQSGGLRGRGRGARGLRGAVQRGTSGKRVHQDEPLWGHDGFEELEPERLSKTSSTRVCDSARCSNYRDGQKVKQALWADKLLYQITLSVAPKAYPKFNLKSRRSNLQSKSPLVLPEALVLISTLSRANSSL